MCVLKKTHQRLVLAEHLVGDTLRDNAFMTAAGFFEDFRVHKHLLYSQKTEKPIKSQQSTFLLLLFGEFPFSVLFKSLSSASSCLSRVSIR